MWRIYRPVALVVSKFSCSERKPMPRVVKTSTMVSSWRMDRARRSSGATTSTSPSRANSKAAAASVEGGGEPPPRPPRRRGRGLGMRGGRGVAGRTVALLGAIFTYAVRQGHRIDNRRTVSSSLALADGKTADR